jgi:hypothetical protein
VCSEAYRDAKVDTILAVRPQVLAVASGPFDLRFTGADGVEHRECPHDPDLEQAVRHAASWPGSRPQMDTHHIGVMTLVLAKRGDAAAFLAALASGHPERFGPGADAGLAGFEVEQGAAEKTQDRTGHGEDAASCPRQLDDLRRGRRVGGDGGEGQRGVVAIEGDEGVGRARRET